MWICLNDAFFSIVSKDCKRNELLIRARRPGDIEKVFPNAEVTELHHADYQFRAVVTRSELKSAMNAEIDRVSYSNFKDSVGEKDLHDAYMRVWSHMSLLQPVAPYAGARMFRDTATRIEWGKHVPLYDQPQEDFFSVAKTKKKKRPARNKRWQ